MMDSVERRANERLRLAALRRYNILDTPPEAVFDDFTYLAASICNATVAVIAFQDETRNWFKSRLNCIEEYVDRHTSFCTHTIKQDDVYEVTDTLSHDYHRLNPNVTREPNVRFYAGAPVCSSDGFNIGTICVLDISPKRLTDHQRNALKLLARQVMAQIELRQANKTIQRLNQTLSETASFNKNVVDNIPATIGYWDKNLICRYANKTYAEKYIQQGIDIVGKSLTAVANKELMQQIEPHIHAVLKGIPQKFEASIPIQDNATLQAKTLRTQVNYIPDIDQHGNISGFYIFALDITALRHAEKEMKLAEIAIESSHTGVLVTDENHFIVSINEQFSNYSGFNQTELIGKQPTLFISEERAQEIIEALSKQSFWYGENTLRKKNGEYGIHFTSIAVLKNEHNEATHHVITVNDITERKKLESELTITQEMLERTGKIASVGGWEYDFSNNEVRWTEQVYIIHELESREAPSQELILSFYREEARTKLQSAIRECIEFETPWDLELPFITAKGNHLWVRTIGEIIKEKGVKTKIAGTFQDITHKKVTAQKAIAKEIELRQTVVREVHHHIKNNIQGLSGILHNAIYQYPELSTPINEAIGQLQSVAIIHGLQGKSLEAAIEVRELTRAISQNIQDIWQTKIHFESTEPWTMCYLSKNEAVPIALILNELMTNAEKHRTGTEPTMASVSQMVNNEGLLEVSICVINEGNFVFTSNLDQDTKHFGLKLINSLMPKIGAYLYLSSRDNKTQAMLTLRYPIVKKA